MKEPVAKCGTRSGYNRHKRLKESVCQPCASAQIHYDRKRRLENPEYFRLKNKRNENKEKKQERWRKREAIRRGSYHEPYTIKNVLETFGTDCYICNTPIDLKASRRSGVGENWEHGLHLDHVIPLSRGGSDSLNNVRPAHAICNLKKGAKIGVSNALEDC